MRGRFDARMGLRYALTSLLKLVILFVAVLSVCAYALTVFSGSAGTAADAGGLAAAGVRCALPFALLPVIAFFAGGYAPGDQRRLAGRIAMCVCMLAFLILLSGGMSYEMNDVLVDSTTGAVAESMSLTAVPEKMMLLLALVPLLSGVDAVLEHLEPSTTKGWGSEKDQHQD